MSISLCPAVQHICLPMLKSFNIKRISFAVSIGTFIIKTIRSISLLAEYVLRGYHQALVLFLFSSVLVSTSVLI